MKRSLLAAAVLLAATPALAASSDGFAGHGSVGIAIFLGTYLFPEIVA